VLAMITLILYCSFPIIPNERRCLAMSDCPSSPLLLLHPIEESLTRHNFIQGSISGFRCSLSMETAEKQDVTDMGVSRQMAPRDWQAPVPSFWTCACFYSFNVAPTLPQHSAVHQGPSTFPTYLLTLPHKICFRCLEQIQSGGTVWTVWTRLPAP
jgi:hypothetical protein